LAWICERVTVLQEVVKIISEERLAMLRIES
jgi:hypothetical protein